MFLMLISQTINTHLNKTYFARIPITACVYPPQKERYNQSNILIRTPITRHPNSHKPP